MILRHRVRQIHTQGNIHTSTRGYNFLPGRGKRDSRMYKIEKILFLSMLNILTEFFKISGD